MGWPETHRYYAALRHIETELNRCRDGVVVWQPEYTEIFGSPENLLLALQTYWRRLVEAQVDDPDETSPRWRQQWQEVLDAHPGLLLAVATTEATKITEPTTRTAEPVVA